MENLTSTKNTLSKIISFRVTEHEFEKVKSLLYKTKSNKSDIMRKIIYRVITEETFINHKK